MKNIIALILVLVCMFSVVGCGSEADGSTSQNSIENKISDAKPNQWGITLKAENVTSKGMSIVCTHSGGENTAKLNTGSYYVIQKSGKSGWADVEYLPQEYQLAWTSEAWIIQKENTTQWDVDWEWLYGKLSAGKYRIGKEIMNFRDAGDFDTEMVYAEFIIK